MGINCSLENLGAGSNLQFIIKILKIFLIVFYVSKIIYKLILKKIVFIINDFFNLLRILLLFMNVIFLVFIFLSHNNFTLYFSFLFSIVFGLFMAGAVNYLNKISILSSKNMVHLIIYFVNKKNIGLKLDSFIEDSTKFYLFHISDCRIPSCNLCKKNFNDNNYLVNFNIKDLNSLNLLAEFASESENEGALEVVRVQSLSLVGTAYSPLIYNMKQDTSYDQLVGYLKIVHQNLKKNPNLTDKIVITLIFLRFIFEIYF
jgi:hypothetical protein